MTGAWASLLRAASRLIFSIQTSCVVFEMMTFVFLVGLGVEQLRASSVALPGDVQRHPSSSIVKEENASLSLFQGYCSSRNR